MTLPVPKVEIAFATGPNDPSPAWVDVTQYTKGLEDLQMTHGRPDQYQAAPPATLELTLLNADGRFTPGNTASPYYPNVKKGRRVRVSVTDNGVTYTRFTGFVNEWPVEWADASATVANVRVGASSRMTRLGISRQLQSIVQTEYGLDGPVAYYPLNDASGSLRAGNVAVPVQPQMAVAPFGGGSNANIAFGNTALKTTPETTAAFTRVSTTAGAYLSMESPNALNTLGNGTLILECFFIAPTTQGMGIAQIDGGASHPTNDLIQLSTSATGKLVLTHVRGGVTFYQLTSVATVTDGLVHHAAAHIVESGAGLTINMMLDGATAGTQSIGSEHLQQAYRLIGGGGVQSSAFAGTLAHVAVISTPNTIPTSRINQHYLAGTTGFSGESSDQRISRIATYAGIPTADVSVETGLSTSLTNQDTTDQIPLSLMQDVTTTEAGVLFDGTNGQLKFHARSHRYNQSPSLTLNGSDLKETLQPKLDDQGLVNDVSASRANGVAVRAVDNASVTDYGVYRQDLTLLTTSDNEVFDAATWKIYLGSQPQVIVPVAEVELAAAATALKAAVLGREVGDRITLQNLPVQAPASSMDFFIEGWTETITGNSHRVRFNLSNALTSGVWQLDSATYAQLGVTTRLAY